ncbi:monooxygenase [Pontimonas salivibrio]|uniref:Monooxygenase n=1 Tax=Pontimonas salivibrio TaxID=1159327 RepID=A0A2L2BRI7_9MICO|nr:NAD(P)/FAD-dependent oxidoreductase [Pontimonas salivibrio]AVG24294.1 monooxygenase [Pontimonas salivibrio]
MTGHTDYDALVIGAGFSGIATLHFFREAGFKTLVVDKEAEVGGTWWVNNYPGVRTDSEYPYYSFSFSKEVREEWDWSERYPTGKEVLSYLKFVVERLDMRKDMLFNTAVNNAAYNETDKVWEVSLSDGRTLRVKYLVSAMGVLSRPIWPDIPGREKFKGEMLHAAMWPREGFDLKGKRVGLIGLGASGLQITPTIAPEVAELKVFQRTPNFVVAAKSPKTTPEELAKVRAEYDEIWERAAGHPFGVDMVPAKYSAKEVSEEERRRIFESKWDEGGFHFANECFNDLATDHESAELASEFIRSKIREIVKDPDTAELLCPKDYAFNGKRVPTGFNYYETYNLPHVQLIDAKTTPITEFTEKGLKVGDTEYELDVIICATGFDAMTGNLTNLELVGRNGKVLREKFAEGHIGGNLGISYNGFPNFLVALGPQTPYSNLPVPIQLGAQWMADAISFARDNGIEELEATPESEEWWAAESERAGKATVMYEQGKKAKAWFLGDNVPGKPRQLQVYMGGGQVYQEFCRQAKEDGFRSFRAPELINA